MRNFTLCKRRVKMILLMMEFSTLLLSANAGEEPTDCFQKLSHVNRRTADGTCHTPECEKAAKAIQESIDESVDPCDDFYQFSCGGWERKHEIPEDRLEVSVFTELHDKIQNQLRVLLEKRLTGTEPEHIKKLKKMYDKCMDEKTIKAEGGEPLKGALKWLRGWPVVEGGGWDGRFFDWILTVISMSKMGWGDSYPIDLKVKPDMRNNSANIIHLDSPTFSIFHRLFVENGVRGQEGRYNSIHARYELIQLATHIGANTWRELAELMEAVDFETSLADLSLSYEDKRNKSMLYNRYTVKQLQEQVPQIDWMKYLNGILFHRITENEPLIVSDPRYIKEFANLISNTDKRVVANYLLWRVALDILPLMSFEYRNLLPIQERPLGETEEKPRWLQCVYALTNRFNHALASYYVKNYFPKESKDKALELVPYFRLEFINLLHSVTWMDQETREHAREKALAMKSFIGYPDELLNDTMVSELYENLKITDGSYYENILRIDRWKSKEELLKLRKPNVFGDWKNHANSHVHKSLYDQVDNSIEFSAGILQNEFFQKDRPHYMNFGSIGSVIGREITHGFDNEGRQHDKKGHIVNWGSAETDARYKEKAKCIIEQYSNYTSSIGLKLNGVNTQGENIADNVGLKEAYRAYQSWVMDHGPEGKLPGLKYTPNQLFWISAASSWCINIRPELLSFQNSFSTEARLRSPNQFRVIGPMSNSPEFSNDFNCAIGSPMNPQKKCEVW